MAFVIVWFVDASDLGSGLFVMRDLSFWDERMASPKHVTRKSVAKTVVVLTINVLVLAPKIDSAEANPSVKPPPRPDCMRITIAKKIQITTCTNMINPVIKPLSPVL